MGSAVLNPVAYCHHCVAVDPVTDRHLPRISRPSRIEGIRACVERVLDLLKRPDLCALLRVHQEDVKMLVPVIALSVCRD